MLCPKCARENPDRNKFCNGCGESLRSEPGPAAKTPPPPPPPPPPPAGAGQAAAAGPASVFGFVPVAEPVEGPPADVPNPAPADPPPAANGANASPAGAAFPGERESARASGPSAPSSPVENFDEYMAEVAHKYRAAQGEAGQGRRLRPIVAASLGGFFLFVGAVVLTLYLTGDAENAAATADRPPVAAATAGPTVPPEMAFVPGGEFTMGSDGGDEYSRPAHRVKVKPFLIDKTEVTCEEYKKFIDATGHRAPPGWPGNNFPSGAARRPVTGVTWDDANAFARWKSKRLPTEAEWELAARGPDGRLYPWGGEWLPAMANADKQSSGLLEVGRAAGQSPYGLFDMSGNAWEWTASDAGAYPNGKSFENVSPDAKIIRGGFYGSVKEKATTTFRRAWGARSENDYGNTGFRCARDAAGPSDK